MLKWLRTFGKTGETLAWILAVLDTKLTVGGIVSLSFGVLAGFWTGLFDFFTNPRVQIAIGVFLATLWTYIGVRVLRSFREPMRTLPQADYRYCISPEGLRIGLDPSNPDGMYVSIIFTLRNVGNVPIRVQVEKFDARIEDRAAQEPDKSISLVIPRVGARSIQSGGFKKDVIKDRNSGTLNLTIVYGDPDGPFVRKYSAKAKLNFIFMKNERGDILQGTVSEETVTEEDAPL